MKNVVGFDLNGWHDLAIRNWQITPGEGIEVGGPFEFTGGVGSVVVTLDEDSREPRYLGGIQALIAPHGSGPGWGEVGKDLRRSQVLALLEKPEDNIMALAMALAALAPGGKFTGILSIPDTSDMRETAQEALLKALRKSGARRGLLVWQPVLALLGALKIKQVAEAARIGVINHCEKGFTTQILELRRDDIATPERQQVGQFHVSDLGLQHLLDRAFDEIKTSLPGKQRQAHLSAAQSPWRMALGEVQQTEVMRAENGDWVILTPPTKLEIPNEEPPASIAEHLSSCDLVLFHSPATGHITAEILEWMKILISPPVLALQRNAIALGALEAAQRLQQNQPIYFDFLPQISTIVQNRGGAKNMDLIPDNARLRAGETYRSRNPAQFSLQQGTRSLSVFLKKENVTLARKATIDLPTVPKENVSVSLSVEQKPASGRARLTLTSDGFSAPRIVDWDSAVVQAENWQAIIDAQRPQLPTVPNRLVLPCGMETWRDQPRAEGLARILERNLSASTIRWDELAGKLPARPEGEYAISSDGGLPADLDRKSEADLDQISEHAGADILARLKGTGSVKNDSLRFLTWQFHRCPQWVVGHMIDALMSSGAKHPFRVAGFHTLLPQGVGRTAVNSEDQKRIFGFLFDLLPVNWKKDQLACAAFLLSRNDNAPKLLSRKDVEFLARVAIITMRKSIGTEYTSTFIYAPYLLVGLLRWRLREPNALVAGADPVASDLLNVTEDVIQDLRHAARTQPKLKKYIDILRDVVEELKGQGINPNLLLDLESLT